MMKHESFSRCKDRDSKLEGHNNASSKSKIKPACDTLQNKPFKGRIFYLDLPCNMKTQHLENDIKTLGGTVEKFFSKDIKYLVSNKPEARYAQRLLPDSPAPSPDSGVSSPHPGSRRESHRHRGSSQGVTDTVAVSRGKSLVERVVKEQERVQMNGILANAVEWGVKVLHVDDVISYIDKRKAKVNAVNAANPLVKGAASIQHTETNAYQRQNAGRIRRPFVKVEDLSRHYRPIYVPLSNMPVCNLRSLPPCSPFLVEEHGKDDSKKKQKEQRSGGTRGKKERRREKKKGGYCECCEVKFDNLKAHMESEQHQAFSKSEEYRVVDRVSAGLTCALMNISAHCRRVKCSTSTSLLCAEAMLPVKEDLGSVNGDWKQESEGSLLWDSTAKHSLSEQNTGKPLLIRKRSRGQCEFSCNNLDSLFDQYDIPEKSQSKRGSFEWEFHLRSAMRKSEGASFLSKEPNCDSNVLECRTDQHIWTNPDTHPAQELDERNQETITGDEYLRTNCCEIYAQSMPENQVENSALWPLANTEPEPDGDSLSNCLQRKVRNIRPKRRRQIPALHIESSKERESLYSLLPVQECESLPVSIPDLLELFQSSENMDEEFKGF